MTADVSANLRRLADFLDANPDIAAKTISRTTTVQLLAYYSGESARADLAAFARAGKAGGAEVEKSYDESWGNVTVRFGPVEIQGYASRERVCVRRVVGTREVTKTVPDPEALAAVPKVTVTETVEDVEWDCLPLLAGVTA